MDSKKYDFDLFVIGGGSGGQSAAKEAAKYNKKIGLADFVKPSPLGTKWEIGGTCVNVGCIPKKLMHYAALLYDNMKIYPLIGYEKEMQRTCNWKTLVANVQRHIYSMNFIYRGQLRAKQIKFFKKLAKLKDAHTIELTDAKGQVETVTADKIVIAVGGRPNYPDIPGAKELCITSDDLFSLKKTPGKTLIIGASYIACETAGFLHGLGFDVTVMVRSTLLRGFDKDMVARIKDILEKRGIKFLYKCSPTKFTKAGEDEVLVDYENSETKEKKSDKFNTVMLAVGRKPDTANLGLENAKIKLAKSGKIDVKVNDETSVNNVYSIGDCAEGRPELTPPAILAGKLLSQRLFNNGKTLMDYTNYPTTIFTPIEYGSCGLSEEKAKELYKDKVQVFHSVYTMTEWRIDETNDDNCYMKVIVNKADKNRIIGFHVFAPNAGEITQGVAVAIKCGVTKDQLDSTIGIHPTTAEEMVYLEIDKAFGDGKKATCCG